MTSLSSDKRVRREYAVARARDIAFDAVLRLWRKRKATGMQQADLAEILGREKGWVSKQLKGPGNWTLRTMAELVEALDGELEIQAFGREEPVDSRTNHDAYSGYERPLEESVSVSSASQKAPYVPQSYGLMSTATSVVGDVKGLRACADAARCRSFLRRHS
jgi:transcriptional regulator with XRE-family HTH domain